MNFPAATSKPAALLLMLLPAMSSSALAEAKADFAPPRIEEGLEVEERFRVEALSAAFKHARLVRFDTRGKVFIVSQRSGQLVVEFRPQQARMYDGGGEFTYDPIQVKIVGVKVDG